MDLDDCKYSNCIMRFLTASNLRLRKPRNDRLAVLSHAQLCFYLVL
jgi:surface polysaccharide O-acyltransferase-like enzyme